MNYLKKVKKNIQSDNESRQNSTDFTFHYACVEQYVQKSIVRFEYEFEELGMKFKNVYNIAEIINSVFYDRYEKSIVRFDEDKTEENFGLLLDSFCWLLFSLSMSKKEGKLLQGEFFQDIVLAALFAYCFYPKLLPDIIEYIHAYYTIECENWKERDFKCYYGYSNIFQLLLFILKFEKSFDISMFKDVNIEQNYRYVLDHILSEDHDEVKEMYTVMANFHISDKDEDYLDVFNHSCWRYFPVEMFAVMLFRNRHSLASFDSFDNELIAYFMPYVFIDKSLPIDNLTKEIALKIEAN